MSSRVALALVALGIAAAGWSSLSVHADEPSGDAFITHDIAARTWTIGSGGASLTLGLDPTRDFEVVRFGLDNGRVWVPGGAPDTFVTTVSFSSRAIPFGKRAEGFVYRGVETRTRGNSVQLDATFDWPTSRLRITRHYSATHNSPTIETWTTFTPLAESIGLRDLNAFHLTLPAGRVRWLNGLQGEASDVRVTSAFTLRSQELSSGERLTLGAKGRASETTVPWFAVDGPGETFYGGLMWSGAWSMSAVRSGNLIDVSLGLGTMATRLTNPIDGPHAFFGAVAGDTAEAAVALRTFIIDGVRQGRPLEPLVTYNTWFAYDVTVDEASMEREIDGAAALGAELFVLDAGWYQDAGEGGRGDFTSGLGNWRVDAQRFPGGLRHLSDYAHTRGLKFGLWVEPERVALSTIGGLGLADERWLAKHDGKYGAAVSAQVCLGGNVARQWITKQLTKLIDDVHPDYLKWDNNLWVNCNREGHVHGEADGNFAHVNGLYAILDDLRTRYPKLLIENVSGGGNRLDLGMMRYTDVAWMDDLSTPATVVRHNVQGLSAVFPPAYLLSFVVPSAKEPLRDAPDLAQSIRSRMIAALGLSFRTGDFDTNDLDVFEREIRTFKNLRATLTNGSHELLTAQVASGVDQPWDVMQTAATDDLPVLLWAFQTDPNAGPFTVKANGLEADVQYEVRAGTRRTTGVATGTNLMTDGLVFQPTSNGAAYIVQLRPLVK